MLTDDSGSVKPEPGVAVGAESDLGTDDFSEKFGECSVCTLLKIQ